MSDIHMRELDRCTVSISIRADAGHKIVRGEAIYEALSADGPQLRVLIEEPTGDFEVILSEQNWDGSLAFEQESDADIVILLEPRELDWNSRI